MKAGRQPQSHIDGTTDSTPGHSDLATFCKALGHPVRVEIMQQLRTLQRCVCGDLVARLPLAQSTVSQHLKVLRQAGLIRCEAAGPSTRYCVDQQNVDALKALIAAL